MANLPTNNTLDSTFVGGLASSIVVIQNSKTSNRLVGLNTNGLSIYNSSGIEKTKLSETALEIDNETMDKTDIANLAYAKGNTPGNAVGGKNVVLSINKDFDGINTLGAATVTVSGVMTANSIVSTTGVTAASVTASGDVGAATVTATNNLIINDGNGAAISVTKTDLSNLTTILNNINSFGIANAGKFFKIGADGKTEYADAGGGNATPVKTTVNELITELSNTSYPIGTLGIATTTGSTFLKLGTISNPYYYLQSSALSLSAGVLEITSGNYTLSGSPLTAPITYDTSLTYTGATNFIIMPNDGSKFMYYQFVVKDEVPPSITFDSTSLDGSPPKHASSVELKETSTITVDNKFNHKYVGSIEIKPEVFTAWTSDSTTTYPYSIQIQDRGSDSATTASSLLYKYINLSFVNVAQWTPGFITTPPEIGGYYALYYPGNSKYFQLAQSTNNNWGNLGNLGMSQFDHYNKGGKFMSTITPTNTSNNTPMIFKYDTITIGSTTISNFFMTFYNSTTSSFDVQTDKHLETSWATRSLTFTPVSNATNNSEFYISGYSQLSVYYNGNYYIAYSNGTSYTNTHAKFKFYRVA
jgi:hypothetical protein